MKSTTQRVTKMKRFLTTSVGIFFVILSSPLWIALLIWKMMQVAYFTALQTKEIVIFMIDEILNGKEEK